MSVSRRPNGRWQAQVYSSGAVVASKTHDTRREAVDWERTQLALLAGGSNLRAGRRRVGEVMDVWLENARSQLSEGTHQSYLNIQRRTPTWLARRAMSSVTASDIQRWLDAQDGPYASKLNYRKGMSAFFGWAAKEGYVNRNPVTSTSLKREDPDEDIRPFTRSELQGFLAEVRQVSDRLADVFELLALTGLRWGEARALRVSDLQRDPRRNLPRIVVERQRTQNSKRGKDTVTKGRRRRYVPLSVEAWKIAERLSTDKRPDELLLTTDRGARLHSHAIKRRLKWDQVAGGHRIHDLRHTAAVNWLAAGIEVTTVSAWLGHSSTQITHRIYLAYLGSEADDRALARLNGQSTYDGIDAPAAATWRAATTDVAPDDES